MLIDCAICGRVCIVHPHLPTFGNVLVYRKCNFFVCCEGHFDENINFLHRSLKCLCSFGRHHSHDVTLMYFELKTNI